MGWELTSLKWRKQNRPEVWLVMKALVEFLYPCGGTSNWPNLYLPIQYTFETRLKPFPAYHQLMRPENNDLNISINIFQNFNWKIVEILTWRCCWHSVHSGSNSCASGIASWTTNVDWTAKQRVQLIKLFRWRNWSASSKPCWHIFDKTSGFGGNKMRIKRLMFCRDNSILVLAQFTYFMR